MKSKERLSHQTLSSKITLGPLEMFHIFTNKEQAHYIRICSRCSPGVCIVRLNYVQSRKQRSSTMGPTMSSECRLLCLTPKQLLDLSGLLNLFVHSVTKFSPNFVNFICFSSSFSYFLLNSIVVSMCFPFVRFVRLFV